MKLYQPMTQDARAKAYWVKRLNNLMALWAIFTLAIFLMAAIFGRR